MNKRNSAQSAINDKNTNYYLHINYSPYLLISTVFQRDTDLNITPILRNLYFLPQNNIH